MEEQSLLGYLSALIIGLVLGLLGGGGSILTVPVFVYLLAIEPVLATAYSLFVVGTASAIGSIGNLRKGRVDVRTAIVFAIPSFIAVYLTRRYLIPAIPDELGQVSGLTITKDMSIMVFFAIIMILAGYFMLRPQRSSSNGDMEVNYNYPLIILEGSVVGLLTGIVGAGGGFLIIPALVLLAKLPMKKAIGTSLLIIAAKSLIGFLGDVQNLSIDWAFLLQFTVLTVAGILLGGYLNRFIPGQNLKRGFGWFVILMAVYIVWMEIGA